MMFTQAQLTRQIKNLGIKSDDVVTVHTSLKSLGELDTSEKTGAEVLIDALRDAVHNGLLVVPAHTFKNVREVPVFDIRNTMPCIGAVPAVAVQLANKAVDCGDKTIVRSYHFTHSVVAFGNDAYDFVKDDRNCIATMSEDSCYGKLYKKRAKILFIGTTLASNTFIHYVDMCNPNHIQPTPFPITGIDYDGTKCVRSVMRSVGTLECSASSDCFVQYEPYLKKAEALIYGKIGDAESFICDAVKCFDVITNLQKDGFCLNPDIK